ncbi:MAG TPA: lipid A deacylase LpxR family protein [Planctomycetota bacterium]|nr:lipid A deacylase LpxR family protein [Planctomycetota bacterium]
MRWRVPILAACAISLASAQDDARGVVYLTHDNDIIAGSDDGYTGGVQIGYVSRYAPSYAMTPAPGRAIARALDGLPPLDRPGRERFVSYSLALRMFTPEDITAERLLVDDQPYVGVLAASATAAAQDASRLDALTITAGVAGPASMAGPAQRALHRALGSNTPRGWHHQIGNEPILNAQYDHRWRIGDVDAGPAGDGDAILSGSVAAGNLQSLATVGIGVRWGHHVAKDYFVPPPFFGQETVGPLSLPRQHGGRASALYLAAGVDGSLIGNLIQFDGNTFRDSHRVDHDHWSARGYAAIHGRVGQVVFALSIVHATITWEKPDGERWEQYGRVSFGWDM